MAQNTSKSKVISGSTKKSGGKKLTKRVALFGLIGILAFSTVAGIGWQKWQDHQLKAKALSLTIASASNYGNYAVVTACKYGSTTIRAVFYYSGTGSGYLTALGVGKSLTNGQSYSVSRIATSISATAFAPPNGGYAGNTGTNGSGTASIYQLPNC